MKKIREFLTFKYIIYLIVICLLAQYSITIRDFIFFLNKKESFWIEIASLLLLLLLICVPYTKTKYKKYIDLQFKEYIIFFIYIILAFTFFILYLKNENSFALISFLFVTFILPFIKNFHLKRAQKETINNKEKNFIRLDNPIDKEEDDLLGRKDFVKNIGRILVNYNNEFKEKGIVLTLSAGWGEGKTSCINLLKNLLIKENVYEFIDINPWFNDTKEKLLSAIFGEINHFTKTNEPHVSLENQFDEIIKLSRINLGNIELALDKFTDDKNIQHKIKNIGDILKSKYKKRIVIILDDLDRLDKDNILFILKIVQMFREYTNIIFILSCNYEKVEQILCENSESFLTEKDKNNEIRKALYYKDYLDKISTIKIDLPKINHFYICDIFKNRMINILKCFDDKNLKLFEKKFYKHVFVDRFKTIRDINRFFNTFVITYPKIKNDVDIYNYINLTILQVFYTDIYKDAYENRYQWCEKSSQVKVNLMVNKSTYSSNEKKNQIIDNFESDIKYFENLVSSYKSYDREILLDLISIISPVYNILTENIDSEKRNLFQKPNLSDDSYFSDNRKYKFYFENIFNEEIENKFKKLQQDNINFDNDILNLDMKQGKDDEIISFLYSIKDDILDFFSYILSNFKKRFINLYRNLIICFLRESSALITKESYKTIAGYITQMILLCYENKNEEYNDFFREIAKTSSSMVLLIDIFRFTYDINNNSDEIVKDINYILDGRISYNLEEFLKSIFSEEYSFLIYAWILNSYINYYPNVLNLPSNEYIKIRQRVKKTMPYMQNNKEYFNIFIWNKLKILFKNLDQEFSSIDDTTEKNIAFYVSIWGRNNIENLIEKKDKETFNYYLRIDKVNKVIEQYSIVLLKKIAKVYAEKTNNIIFEEDINKYDFVKNLNYPIDAINSQLSSVNNTYIQETNLLKIEVLNKTDIENLNSSDYFEDLQEYAKRIIVNIKNNKINIKHIQLQFTIYFVCNEEFKDKLNKKIDNIMNNLNIKDFTIATTIETKEYLLEKY